MGKPTDPLRRERYAREVKRTNETAAKILRDAQEAYTVNALTSEQLARMREMAEEYRRGTLRLLRYLYDVEDSQNAPSPALLLGSRAVSGPPGYTRYPPRPERAPAPGENGRERRSARHDALQP